MPKISLCGFLCFDMFHLHHIKEFCSVGKEINTNGNKAKQGLKDCSSHHNEGYT